MPTKAKRLCNHPGCGAIVNETYCEEHKKIVVQRRREILDRRRGSSASRGYDSKWQKLRLYKLATDGLCEMCERHGKVERATLVHHIKPINDGGTVLEWDNLMSLCEACHQIIHQELAKKF